MVNMLEPRIQRHFFDSADLKNQCAEALGKPIAHAVQAVLGCITAGGKVLSCGDGRSASDARLFAAHFVGRFERERPGLAALALGTDLSILPATDDRACDQLFAQQVQALGNPGDVLLVITTRDDAPSVLAAVDAAHDKDMTVIALTGRGGRLGERLTETDVHVGVPHERAARIQEVHLLTIHCLCDAVDAQLLGEQDPA